MVLPSTVRDEPLVIAVARSLDDALAVPTNWVAAVIAAGVVLSLLRAAPVAKALTGGAGVPNGKGLEAKSEGLRPPPAVMVPACAPELAGVFGVVGRFAAY